MGIAPAEATPRLGRTRTEPGRIPPGLGHTRAEQTGPGVGALCPATVTGNQQGTHPGYQVAPLPLNSVWVRGERTRAQGARARGSKNMRAARGGPGAGAHPCSAKKLFLWPRNYPPFFKVYNKFIKKLILLYNK